MGGLFDLALFFPPPTLAAESNGVRQRHWDEVLYTEIPRLHDALTDPDPPLRSYPGGNHTRVSLPPGIGAWLEAAGGGATAGSLAPYGSRAPRY